MREDQEKRVVETVVGELVKLRIRKGISQQRLSEIAAMSRSGLRHMENLETTPTLYTLLRITRALDVSLSRLLARAIKSNS